MQQKITRVRRAQLVADAVAVLCPWCGEPQPTKSDGSEQWMPKDFAAVFDTPRQTCIACDRQMLIVTDSKVMFDNHIKPARQRAGGLRP